jgi:small GTP-binding protein
VPSSPAGSEKYKTVTASYYRKAHAAILLFDVTKESSFHNVAEWLANVRQYAKEQTLLFLAGNKIDLRGRFDCVDSSRVKAFASKEHLLYFDVSALEGSGVSECFERVVEDILNQRER